MYIKIIIVFVSMFICSKSAYTQTIKGLEFIDIPQYREVLPPDMIYNQVISSSKSIPFGDIHGRSSNIHETVHGINNELRNEYKKTYKKNVNAFYAGNRKGIVVENPKIMMMDIIPNIPESLKGYRYNLYFTKQIRHWNDVPTYVVDEWSAYIAGAECAVDDFNRNIPQSKSDYVSGALEFSIYALCLAITVKENDPNYWINNTQFKEMIRYYLIKSEKTFMEGQQIFPSEQQVKMIKNLKHSADASSLRKFLLTEFDGIFLQ
jgi:hypothetical protein